VGVDIAADLDQPGFDALGGVADRGGRIVGEALGHGDAAFLNAARIM
jgi:hypothetical protein